ncbi:MAG: SdrD B-like domain-containing protein [Thiolinea sp.]
MTYDPTATNDHIYEFDLDLGTVLSTPECLDLTKGHITGTVYTDVNGNDGLDLMDTPIEAVTVNLIDEASGSVVTSTPSNSAGLYSFTNLDTGLSYRITVDTTDPDLGGKSDWYTESLERCHSDCW